MSTGNSRSIAIVDDDDLIAELVKQILEQEGYDVTVFSDSVRAVEELPELAPEAILIDLMMPKLDGYGVIQELRDDSKLAETKFIVLSSKSYEHDRKQAFKQGAHGFIDKSSDREALAGAVRRLMEDKVNVSFWGCRGTLPRPGADSVRYGGNTNCVSLEFPRGQMFVFDAGSGIKQLSNHLMARGKKSISAKIFISHPHWDHINALPFFVPLYVPGNEFEIIGARHGALTMREIASAQMDGVYFPITLKEFGARVYFRDLGEEEIEIEGIKVETMLLSHPGICLGFKVTYDDRSVCYITDNEMFLHDSGRHNSGYEKKLADFVRGTDVLITDSTYTDDEYMTKVGWGHSCLSKVAELAANAEVKTLCLYHHDPDQNDDDIDEKLKMVRDELAKLKSDVECIAPAEGDSLQI
ncbi:MAG: response regulator [Rhodospirillales bacterium]